MTAGTEYRSRSLEADGDRGSIVGLVAVRARVPEAEAGGGKGWHRPDDTRDSGPSSPSTAVIGVNRLR